ncbi:choice-of-anchor L domain-containing protein [Croceiramulus getboli]|nr:choice-of-anchor L domain-containing protein [Flavobacteriaceae bacterium YJPT1-3]
MNQLIIRFLQLGLLCYAVQVSAQAVTVDVNAFTVEELVRDVLIGSTTCGEVTNITYRTGTNATDPERDIPTNQEANGIGYFQSNGGPFPFQGGVILATGDARDARGPVTGLPNSGLDDSPRWQGDPELANIISSPETFNATIIEFDFVTALDFISFDFIMASNEFDGNLEGGEFECEFSDVFAFLLTAPDGTTTNLAIVPGTNQPIAVTNIHPPNPACPDAVTYPEYFDRYNDVGTGAVNYSGQTVAFTAQSTVIPNQQYHIKLAIADDEDEQVDSAIFLREGSFDLGIDLGPDRTAADVSAVCTPELTLGEEVLDVGTYQWNFFDENSGVFVPIAGADEPFYTVTESGRYRVDVILPGCTVSDEINVEFVDASPIALPPGDLLSCDGLVFDLADSIPAIIDGGDPNDFTVNFYQSAADAEADMNAIPMANWGAYQPVGGEQTIYVRVDNPMSTECDPAFTEFVIRSGIPPETLTVEVAQASFTPGGRYTVIATATPAANEGVYTYSLDDPNGPYQNSPVFEGVGPGTHVIYARNSEDCGLTASAPFTILDFIRYFTPNNDGFHDTWNILGLEETGNSNARIFIFDRYGKLIKQLIPNSPGWDGTYNGVPMPADDYWFRIEYREPGDGTPKKFSAHFSLIR